MKRPETIARQSRCPSGVLGRLIALVMARDTAATNTAALEVLQLQSGHRLLEVGFGHGRTLQRALGQIAGASAIGIDISDTMLKTASRRLQHLGDRVQLQLASSDRIPCPDEHFDRALAVHTIYFWDEPARHLREIRRVLRPGGRLVLGFTSAEDADAVAAFPASVYRFHTPDEIRTLLSQAGFDEISFAPAADKLIACAL